MKFKFLKIILIISLICLLKADLPVHCRKSQIIGKWTFQKTKAHRKSIQELYENKCGHESPSHTDTSFLSFSKINIQEFTQSFEVEFKNDEAVYGGNV